MRELEPHALGIRGLWSPGTGIVDFRAVANAYADDIRAAGGTIETGRAVTGLDERPDGVLAATSGGDVLADRVDRLRRPLVGPRGGADRRRRLASGSCRSAATTTGSRRTRGRSCRGLIYPVPDPRFPFLGIHFTRRTTARSGPARTRSSRFARDGYRRYDVDLREVVAIARHAGFWRLARRFWRTGLAEQWRDLSKRAFADELRRYVPELRERPAAVRAVRRPSPGDRPRRDAGRRLPPGRQPARSSTSATRPRRARRRRWRSPGSWPTSRRAASATDVGEPS